GVWGGWGAGAPEPSPRPVHAGVAAADERDAHEAPDRGGRDRNAEGLGRRFAARGGAHRGDVVAGHGLVRWSDQGLHFLVFVWGDAVDGLGLEIDFPSRRNRARQLDLFGRRGPRIGEDHRDRRFLAGGSLGAENTFPARDIDFRLAGDVEDEVGRGGGIIGRYFRRHVVFSGRDRVRRPHP